MNDDLVTWLRAQLDEDERVAKLAAIGNGAEWTHQPTLGEPEGYVDVESCLLAGSEVLRPGDIDEEMLAHIARHNPARVLREVEAKRKRIDLALEIAAERGHGFWRYAGEQLLKLEALPYADRPGYRDEWRP